MKKAGLLKYQLGLAVVGLFAVVLVVIVLLQAGATKQDTETFNRATSIAQSLTDNINDQGVIPSSLAAANIKSVPSTISYQKLSETQYKFCVDYKATSSGFDAGSVTTDFVTGVSGQSSSANNTDTTDLFIDSSHHKGENCQTITPYIFGPVCNDTEQEGSCGCGVMNPETSGTTNQTNDVCLKAFNGGSGDTTPDSSQSD